MREELKAIADRYAGRLEARVAEHSGGLLDISLEVDGLSVGCIRLGSDEPFMVYREVGPEPMAMDARGEYVPLPQGNWF